MNKELRIKFVFFGTGDFAVKILEILYQNNFVPELIVTTPDKPKGRKMQLQPTPVKLWAQKNNIKTSTDYTCAPPSGAHTHCYDLFIVADYGKIIPKEILEIPKYGSLNVHPSLLPKFRGSSPIQSFILSGEEETGVTIILIDEEMDHGDIVAKSEIRSTKSETYKELEEKLAEFGGKLLVEIIPQWIDGKIKPEEQDHSKATFTKKITKKDGLIDLNEPAEIIERKIRAFTPWPGAYFFANKKRIIIIEAKIENNHLIIKRIKPEGKNEMNFEDFLRGNRNIDWE
ncbi:MAG: methionyl-tRNA formyltransferase [Candidatus Terrybacteria bacterium]|nr:methionyl-tRNA formyltransferase [Candidatus Terrybacteria bacterium]